MREALTRTENLVAACANETGVQTVDALLDAMMCGCNDLRRGRRRGCRDIRGRVGDSRVGRVADSNDYRHGASGDRACDALVIKAVQVFPASAAARHEDDIGAIRIAAEPSHAGRDLDRATWTLHSGWINKQIHRGVSATANLHDVAQSGAMLARHDTYAARKARQRTLVVEQALTAKALLKFTDCGE
jgi:hypothetical protein